MPSVRRNPLRLHDALDEVAEEERRQRRAVKPEVRPFRRHPPLNLRLKPHQPRLLQQRHLEAPQAEEVEEEEEEEEEEAEEALQKPSTRSASHQGLRKGAPT